MGILYVPEKKVTVADILSKQPDVDLNFFSKVSGRPVAYYIKHIVAVVLKSGIKRN